MYHYYHLTGACIFIHFPVLTDHKNLYIFLPIYLISASEKPQGMLVLTKPDVPLDVGSLIIFAFVKANGKIVLTFSPDLS